VKTHLRGETQVSKARPGPPTQNMEISVYFRQRGHGPSEGPAVSFPDTHTPSEGPPGVMKSGSYSATTLPGRTARMLLINATALNRKSGGAQWRDLRFSGPFLEMCFRQSEAWWEGRAVSSHLQPIQPEPPLSPCHSERSRWIYSAHQATRSVCALPQTCRLVQLVSAMGSAWCSPTCMRTI
jgi:hypothetical protein